MARQIIERLVDDIDGTPANNTITFSVDGSTYSIDLSGKHESALRSALSPFLAVARKARPETRAGSAPGARAAGDKNRNAAMRAWALSEGVQLPSRGRIAGVVQDAYASKDGAALRAGLGLEVVEDTPKRRRNREAQVRVAA
jgi:hypothetical protein